CAIGGRRASCRRRVAPPVGRAVGRGSCGPQTLQCDRACARAVRAGAVALIRRSPDETYPPIQRAGTAVIGAVEQPGHPPAREHAEPPIDVRDLRRAARPAGHIVVLIPTELALRAVVVLPGRMPV